MKNLSHFRPAEIMLLQGDTQAKNLIKATVYDLIMRKVLATRNVLPDEGRQELDPTYHYVTQGEAFKQYTAVPHEAVILEVFKNDSQTALLVNNLAKLLMQKYGRGKGYARFVQKSHRISDCYENGFWASLFGSFQLNAKGQQLRKEIGIETEEAQYQFSNSSNSTGLAMALGANLMLLGAVGGFNEAFGEVSGFNPEEERRNDGGGCGATWSFDAGFDAGCSGGGGDGGSGCSGASCGGGGCGGGGCGS